MIFILIVIPPDCMTNVDSTGPYSIVVNVTSEKLVFMYDGYDGYRYVN